MIQQASCEHTCPDFDFTGHSSVVSEGSGCTAGAILCVWMVTLENTLFLGMRGRTTQRRDGGGQLCELVGATHQDGESEGLAFCLCFIPSGNDLSKHFSSLGLRLISGGGVSQTLKFFCKYLDSGIPWTFLLIQSL